MQSQEIISHLRAVRRTVRLAKQNAKRGEDHCRLYHQAHQATGRREAYENCEIELTVLIQNIEGKNNPG